MEDVIEVLEKGYRSVSDEEIKKYTDFMVWFASVAKSACPHNNGEEAVNGKCKTRVMASV